MKIKWVNEVIGLMLIFISTLSTFAATETVNGITWTYTVLKGQVLLGTPAIPTSTVGNISIPSMLGGKPVTSIREQAFSSCSGLKSVTIPSSVTSIGDRAFYKCSGLTSVTIPNSVTNIGESVFILCSGLTSVDIPSSVTSIGDAAFCFCSGLTSVTIPSSVTTISGSLFEGCGRLTSVTIPSNVTSVGYQAFRGCSGLTSMMIPESVTSIGGGAFIGCSGLNSLAIPNGVSRIENFTFSSCSGLRSVTIPDSVTSIGDRAFDNCSGLTSVTIPNSVTNIGSYAFSGCSGFTDVTIPVSIVSISTNAFNACNSKLNVFLPTTYAGTAPSNGTITRYKPEQTVTFDVQSEIAVPDPIVAAYGAVYGSLPSLTRPGYSLCWTLDGVNVGEDTVVSALDDHTLVAQWVPIQYTVTFDANGGAGGTSGNQDFDSAIVAPTVTRTGYTFVGWSPSVPATVPLGGAIYTAQWEINQYTVIFDANGGIGGTSGIQDYGTVIVAPMVTRSCYTFKGWSPSVAATVPANDVTYTAQWTPNKYTVTFDASGGSGGWSRSLDYDSAIVAPTVIRSGYTFKGWSPNVAATVPANDVTYTAQWEINTYTVSFNANGGVGGTRRPFRRQSQLVT